MYDRFKSMNLYNKVYLVITVLVLFCFVLLPAVQIGNGVSTAFYLPLSLIFGLFNLATKNSSSAQSFDKLMSTNGIQVALIILYFLTWYIVLYYTIVVLVRFAKGQTKYLGIYARRGFVWDIVTPVIFWIIRLIAIRSFVSQLNDIFGSLTSFIRVGADYEFNLIGGFYILLVLGLVGYFSPKIVNFMQQKGYVSKIEKMAAEGQTQIQDNYNQNPIHKEMDVSSQDAILVLSGPSGDVSITSLPATIGRNKDEVNVPILSDSISRKHCSIAPYNDQMIITDLNSTYGTYLNGEKLIPGNAYIILSGDTLKLGDIEYTLQTPGIDFDKTVAIR